MEPHALLILEVGGGLLKSPSKGSSDMDVKEQFADGTGGTQLCEKQHL